MSSSTDLKIPSISLLPNTSAVQAATYRKPTPAVYQAFLVNQARESLCGTFGTLDVLK